MKGGGGLFSFMSKIVFNFLMTLNYLFFYNKLDYIIIVDKMIVNETLVIVLGKIVIVIRGETNNETIKSN